jgi:hypothetical protein
VILLDTSVWIETFRAHRPLDLDALLDSDDVVTRLPVVQEPLFLEAVALYRAARRAGRSVRSSVDCLIAARALRSDLEVLHRDRDYAALAAISGLRQRTV